MDFIAGAVFGVVFWGAVYCVSLFRARGLVTEKTLRSVRKDIAEQRRALDEKYVRIAVAKCLGQDVDRDRLINDLEHGGYISKKLADELRAEEVIRNAN